MAKELFSTVKDIFSCGIWNGDAYTEADLDDMIKNFELLKKKNFTVALKADFFKSVDPAAHGGQPALGIITELIREGKKLYATIENIPRVIKELIDRKAYKQVSAEVIWNMKSGEERLHRVLAGVALLGVEHPGVKNLNEFAALYNIAYDENELIKSYVIEENTLISKQEEKKMDELKAQLAELAKNFTALQGEVKTHKEKSDALAAEVKTYKEANDALIAEKKTRDDAAAQLADSQKAGEIKTFVDSLKAEGKLLPAQEAAVSNILANIDASKTVKFTVNEKEEEVSILKMFRDFVAGLPKQIDLDASKSTKGETEPVDNTPKKLDEMLKTFTEKSVAEAGEVSEQKKHFIVMQVKEQFKLATYTEAFTKTMQLYPELA